MTTYPEQSHLQQWEITENGDAVHLRFVHKGGEPDSLIALNYSQLDTFVRTITNLLVQIIAIRSQNGKLLPTDVASAPPLPMAVDQFQLNIAEDRSHAVLQFRLPNRTIFLFAMPVTHLEGIAKKILADLGSYGPNASVH